MNTKQNERATMAKVIVPPYCNCTPEEFAAARTGGSLLSLEAALGEALDDARQFTPVAKDHTREAAGARPKTSRKP